MAPAIRSPSAPSVRDPAERHVIGQPVEEPRGHLIDGLDRRILQPRQRRAMGRMDMQRHAGLRQGPVQRRMDRPRARIGRVGPVHRRRIVRIYQKQVRGPHPAPMHPSRVDEELAPIRRDRGREMVRHPLVPACPAGQSNRRGKINAGLRFVESAVLMCHCSASCWSGARTSGPVPRARSPGATRKSAPAISRSPSRRSPAPRNTGSIRLPRTVSRSPAAPKGFRRTSAPKPKAYPP